MYDKEPVKLVGNTMLSYIMDCLIEANIYHINPSTLWFT